MKASKGGSRTRMREVARSKGSENMHLALGETNTSQPGYRARARVTPLRQKGTGREVVILVTSRALVTHVLIIAYLS